MPEVIYLYDGSLDGFLCCIFESYAKKEIPTDILQEELWEPTLYSVRAVPSDGAHARRVLRRVAVLSPYAADLLQRGFLTCLDRRELFLYRIVAKLLREGPGFLRNPADEVLYPVIKAVRALNGEAQLLRGFVRFSEFSGVLGAEIEPKNRVLPLLRGHFCSRYRNEAFFIYDRVHREALFYADGKARIVPLEHFEMEAPGAEEAGYRLLWKRFYDTVAIRERYNPKCRMTHMPKRYWDTMTEFQPPSYFRAKNSPSERAVPFAPNGRPGLAKPAESGPSDPG